MKKLLVGKKELMNDCLSDIILNYLPNRKKYDKEVIRELVQIRMNSMTMFDEKIQGKNSQVIHFAEQIKEIVDMLTDVIQETKPQKLEKTKENIQMLLDKEQPGYFRSELRGLLKKMEEENG